MLCASSARVFPFGPWGVAGGVGPLWLLGVLGVLWPLPGGPRDCCSGSPGLVRVCVVCVRAFAHLCVRARMQDSLARAGPPIGGAIVVVIVYLMVNN